MVILEYLIIMLFLWYMYMSVLALEYDAEFEYSISPDLVFFDFIPPVSGFLSITCHSVADVSITIKFLHNSEPLFQGNNSLTVHSSYFHPDSIYIITIINTENYKLLLTNPHSIYISDSKLISSLLPNLHQCIYTYCVSSDNDYLELSLTHNITGEMDLIVKFISNRFNTTYPAENTIFGKKTTIQTYSPGMLEVTLVCYQNCSNHLLIDTGNPVNISSEVTLGSASHRLYRYYPEDPSGFLLVFSEFNGHCDLFLSSEGSGQKLSKFIDSQGSKIWEMPGNQDLYEIDLRCVHDTAFMLSLLHNSTFQRTRINPGMPYFGLARSDFFYTVHLQPLQNISVVLTLSSGTAGLYLVSCGGLCKDYSYRPSDNALISRLTNTVADLFAINRDQASEYLIGVMVKTDTVYHLSAIVDNGLRVLKAGIPQHGAIQLDRDASYRYVARAGDILHSFRVLNIAGETLLCVGAGMGLENTIEKSTENGEIDVFYSEIQGGTAIFKIVVRSWGPARYLLMGNSIDKEGKGAVMLNPGQLQTDLMKKGCIEQKYFSLPAVLDKDTLAKIQIIPTHGEFTIDYAKSNNIYNTSIEWISQGSYNFQISLPALRYHSDSTYFLRITAINSSEIQNPSYKIICEYSNYTTLLPKFISIAGGLSPKSYNVYEVIITTNYESIFVSLDAVKGNPEIYASFHTSLPMSTDFDYHFAYKEDLNLTWKKYGKYCPEIPSSINGFYNTFNSCALYISIYSNDEADYNIFLFTEGVNITSLSKGVVRNIFLNKGTKYISTAVSTTFDLDVDMYSYLGNIQFYAKIYKFQDSFDIFNLQWPSAAFNDYHTLLQEQNLETVTILCLDMIKRTKDYLALILIALDCLSLRCSMYIIGDSLLYKTIIEGSTYTGSIPADKNAQYNYYHLSPSEDIAISLTSLRGDGDIYVFKGTEAYPTPSFYQWSSATGKNDSVLIRKNDTFFQNSSIEGDYLITIHAFSDCVYELLIVTGDYRLNALAPGIPSNAVLEPNAFLYFSYENKVRSDIRVTVTPIYGQVLLYARSQNRTESIYSKLPSPLHYSWSSHSQSNRHSLLIASNTTDYCVSCNMLIGVLSEVASNITISATNQYSYQGLSNGIPHRGELSTSSWDFYQFLVNETSDLHVSLTSFGGNSDMFIDTSPSLTFHSAKWRSIAKTGADYIKVLSTDTRFATGYFYIGVYAMLGCTYSITAHLQNSLITLVNGWPQTYGTSSNNLLFFQYYIESRLPQNISCSLRTLESRRYPSVYLLLAQGVVYPSPENFTYAYGAKEFSEAYDTLFISVEIPKHTQVYVGVQGGAEPVEFELLCRDSLAVGALRLGREVLDRIEFPVRSRVYEVSLQKKGELWVYVVPCHGTQMLEISSNWTLVNMDIPDITVVKLMDGKLVGNINNAEGVYFITVSSVGNGDKIQGTCYEIVAYFSDFRVYQHAIPGDGGNINVERSADIVKISWKPVVYENFTEISKEVKYYVYLSESAEFESLCALQLAEIENKTKSVGVVNGNSIEFPIDKKMRIAYVIGVLPQSVNIFRYAIYDSIEIPLTVDTQYLEISIIVLILLVLILLLILYCLRKRIAHASNKIEIEMTTNREPSTITIEKKSFERYDGYVETEYLS